MFESFDPLILCIPFIAGFIGWVTNWLAIKATLYPVEFFGIKPVFGWQGVIPKNAEQMSLSFSTMIREQLIDMQSIVTRLKQDDAGIDELVDDISDRVIIEFSTQIAPEKWQRSRGKLRQYIQQLVAKNVREVIHAIIDRFAEDAEDLVDIDAIMLDAMISDRGLMGQVLYEIARPEFKFIEMSGLYFGFLLGVIQMFVWMTYSESWVLPAAGFFVGFATNWMALTLIFEPSEPKVVGPFKIQGLFVKRQYEAAEQFANVVCEKVLTAKNILTHMTSGTNKQKLQALIETQIDQTMAVYEKDPMVAMLADASKIQQARHKMKQRLADAESSDWDTSNPLLENLATKTDLMRTQILQNLRKLKAGEFNGILRPVFQKDEWKLWLAGGLIGVAIGVLQVIYIFGRSF